MDTLTTLVAMLEIVDPTSGFGALAREGGPWVFVAVATVTLQAFWTRATIRLYRDTAAQWKALYDVEVERGRVRDDQVERLLVATEAQNRALESIAAEARRGRGRP